MRTGYAIRDRANRQWLQTRTLLPDVPCPMTVWVQDEADAMTFRHLGDARKMLRVVRESTRMPEAIHILTPTWKVVS